MSILKNIIESNSPPVFFGKTKECVYVLAQHKDYSYTQGKFILIFFEKQILPGTFEYFLNQINGLKKPELLGKLTLCQRAFSTGSLGTKSDIEAWSLYAV